MDENDPNQITTVLRAFQLLKCFSTEKPELTVTELSCMLGVHKSTISRMLTTLTSLQIVNRNPETGRFRLGIGLLELASKVTLHADLRQIARAYLRKLSEDTQEMVNLAVLDSDESVNIDQAVSYDRHISGIGWLGRRTPLHVSSTGKVFLAYLPEHEITRFLSKPLERYTEFTITDPFQIRDEIQAIRKRGYGTGIQELEIGLNAVAAPIRNHNGDVIAAVSVTAPSPRLNLERIENEISPLVVSIARQISARLGYLIGE